MIAGSTERHRGERDGGHPAREEDRVLGALQRGQTGLHQLPGGVAVAGIDKRGALARERGYRVIERRKGIDSGGEKRRGEAPFDRVASPRMNGSRRGSGLDAPGHPYPPAYSPSSTRTCS